MENLLLQPYLTAQPSVTKCVHIVVHLSPSRMGDMSPHRSCAREAGPSQIWSPWFDLDKKYCQDYNISDVMHLPSHHIRKRTQLRKVFLSVLISASVWLYLILIFSKNIILRLDCRLFCVSHLYLPFHFYLSPLFFEGPHQFFCQIPDSIFNSVSFCSSFIASNGKSIRQWNF